VEDAGGDDVVFQPQPPPRAVKERIISSASDKKEEEITGLGGSDNPSTEFSNLKQPRKKAFMQQLIERAPDARSSWTEFQIDSSDTTISDTAKAAAIKTSTRAPVSFSLAAPTKRRTKKNQTKAARGSVEGGDTGMRSTQGQLGVDSGNVVADEAPALRQRPRWTAVLDTCCFLDDGGIDAIGRLLRLAESSQYHSQYRNDNDNDSRHPAASLDEIQLVIPYVVWSELDGIIKRPDRRCNSHAHDSTTREEELSRRARRATNMLRCQLDAEAAALRRDQLLHVTTGDCVVLHSQTMEDAKAAAKRHLPKDTRSVVNDDCILACALAERSKLAFITAAEGLEGTIAFAAAGGVTLLTKDRNLSCKALANGLRVFSPEEFYTLVMRRSEVRKGILREQKRGR
jgi:hypothetical protein